MIRHASLAACGVLVLCLLFLPACTEQATVSPLSGTVIWVHDGDTLKIDGFGTVRLIGIDTPEREGSERDAFFIKQGIPAEQLRRISREALRFNIDHVKGRKVTLQTGDPERDRHGRLLAFVNLPDGRQLNRLLIEQGYAVVYRRFDFLGKEDFLVAESVAKDRELGLWSTSDTQRN